MPRDIPAGLLAHKKSSTQTLAWCWAIKPQVGDWEAYTSYDDDLVLPALSFPGGDVPAMEYSCSTGVAPTSIPTRLALGKDGVDVTVLKFDPDRLQRAYYRGAEFIVFEINPRGDLSQAWVALAGFLGNTQMGDNQAQIELVPWTALASKSVVRKVNVLCDNGLYPGEDFGTGRCRNPVLGDGPLRANWTSQATVTAVTSLSKLRVQYATTAINGNTLSSQFASRLAEGSLLFLSESQSGGVNAGVKRDVKRGTVIDAASRIVEIELHQALPILPQINNVAHLTVGCRRTSSDCKWFGNYSGANPSNPQGGNGYNFQGFDQVPGKDGVMQQM